MNKIIKEYPHYSLGIILILLKITNILNISWFFILLPFWWFIRFMALMFAVLSLYYYFIDTKSKK